MRTRKMTAALAALLCTALIPAGALPAAAVEGAITQFDVEQSLSDWAGRGAASVALSADQHYAGAKSLYCSGRTASWNGAAIPLDDSTVQAGQTYSFSAEALYPTGEDADTFYLSFQYKDTAGEPVYDHIAMANARRGEWVQLENTAYQIPAGRPTCISMSRCPTARATSTSMTSSSRRRASRWTVPGSRTSASARLP